MKTESGHAVSTLTELNYLKGLGLRPMKDAPMSRIAMLRGYLAGAEKRKCWGPLDKDVVVAYAADELRVELANEARLNAALSPQAEKPGYCGYGESVQE